MVAALAEDAAEDAVEPRAEGEEVVAELTTPTRATVVVVVVAGKVVVEGEEVVAGARARGEAGAAELTTPTRVTVVVAAGKVVGVAAAAERANRSNPDPRATSTNSARAKKS